MTRVAVQLGSAWVRVATEERLLAELPAGEVDPSTLLAGLLDEPVDELVVVHPAGARRGAGTGDAVAALAASVGGPVRAVPAPVAALAQYPAMVHPAPAHPAPADAVVVDVGHGGAEVAYLRRGRVVAVQDVAAGGVRLDAVTAEVVARAGAVVGPAEARRVREGLSLLPSVRAGVPPVPVAADDLRAALVHPLRAVVGAVGALVAAVGPVRAPPVLLVGGVARTPLLAELLDEEAAGATPSGGAGLGGPGFGEVHVVDRPDAAAVTGALRVAAGADQPEGGPRAVRPPTVPAPGVAAGEGWLPPLPAPRHRRARVVAGGLGAVAAAAGLLAAGAAPSAGPARAPVLTAESAADLVQYGYAVHLPLGWTHTGGLPERRRSLLTPTATPDGSDLISVERTPLGYDASAEPRRARTELRAEFAAAVAAGAPLAGFDDDARYAGRPVVSYREADDATGTRVHWYVVLDGDAQLSVGCRSTPRGTEAVDAACAAVVGSLRRTR